MRTLAPTDQPKAQKARRRIVLTTFGSLGDLYPYITIAQGLQARGHEAVDQLFTTAGDDLFGTLPTGDLFHAP